MKTKERILKNPTITTTWPLNSRADVKSTLNKLERKIFIYGVLSDREQAYWNEHNKFMFGKVKVAKL